MCRNCCSNNFRWSRYLAQDLRRIGQVWIVDTFDAYLSIMIVSLTEYDWYLQTRTTLRGLGLYKQELQTRGRAAWAKPAWMRKLFQESCHNHMCESNSYKQ